MLAYTRTGRTKGNITTIMNVYGLIKEQIAAFGDHSIGIECTPNGMKLNIFKNTKTCSGESEEYYGEWNTCTQFKDNEYFWVTGDSFTSIK